MPPPPERPNIFKLYEENIGPLTPLIADALKDAEKTYPPEWVPKPWRSRSRKINATGSMWKRFYIAGRKKAMPKSKIDETLKKMAAGTPKASSQITSSIEALGDPDCPFCHGLGYVRRDLEPGFTRFWPLEICTCRQAR